MNIEETQPEELELEDVQEEMLTNVDFIKEASENKIKIENVLQESYGENNEEFYHSTEYGEVLEEIESEIPPLLKEEFILESFCKAVGCNVNYNKCSAESNKATADAECCFGGWCIYIPHWKFCLGDLHWSPDLGNCVRGILGCKR